MKKILAAIFSIGGLLLYVSASKSPDSPQHSSASENPERVQEVSLTENKPAEPQGDPRRGPNSVTPNEDLSSQIQEKLTAMESSSNPVPILEAGLAETSSPESLPYRLMLLEKAEKLRGQSEDVRRIALHEMNSNSVFPDEINTETHDRSLADNMRLIVKTSYSIYLNTQPSQDVAYNETRSLLANQNDSTTRRMIIYSCLEHFPDLKGSFSEE